MGRTNQTPIICNGFKDDEYIQMVMMARKIDLVRDVIGAHQEESFGIRQNHSMGLAEWDALAKKYFADQKYDAFVPERGWGETIVKRAALSNWRAARWLGGTLAGVLKKSGQAPASKPYEFHELLRCPDCHAPFSLYGDMLRCSECAYTAKFEDEVYNLLPSGDRAELYPGDRDDIIDFSLPSHEQRLLGDWYKLEGVHGNMYRWIGARADARLLRVKPGPQRLRIRGHAQQQSIPGEIRIVVNGAPLQTFPVERTGLFILEADLPDAAEYIVEIHASPTWSVPTDPRTFSVSLSNIRLIPAI
ncbi:MAG: hypothetical protein WDO18_04135 [Acidobacteriota bacterium]